ncbi:DUF6378 domain-containing protein [Rhodococcus qingshengii]|uniref:DUF6378 domain-containing protein n=1 Tax=Rhodococcus TaxID=1827 RepID=UPI001E5B8541|nr:MULTISPECIES: DUF6378 domain-containing protein [Rhodococcus]MCD2099574.1 DUF6378 domain-containing protein [Rhodococcus rhodochrous]MCD2123942.1 DUF6378 domain-containing protein [Rhodococcus rhodochrous]MCQ4136629.1 DUF6378 domain-containing protein [Rhodococcus rhodochrous]MDJ0490585.1 DUF6378 domain-containing protein [Rhodococcus qingshengii]
MSRAPKSVDGFEDGGYTIGVTEPTPNMNRYLNPEETVTHIPRCGFVNPEGLQCVKSNGHELAHLLIEEAESKQQSVLDEAKSIVAGARATEYGEGAENSLPRIAAYWSTYLGRELSARDAANMMVLLKMARESHKPKRDNHVDAIGYLALAEQCDGSESG